jgi:hypothetical protein
MAALNKGRNIAAGVGLAALAAAAAGAVFLYGTEAGKKRRKDIKSWSLRMKADVIDSMEKMKDWSEEAYEKTVDTVAQKYKTVKGIDPAEVAALVATLRGHWKAIKRQVEGVAGSSRSAPKKARTTKKSASKKSAGKNK